MNTAAPYVAPRTCTVVNEGEATRGVNERSAPLSDYANAAAYVLIAEPGAGKTMAFESEAVASGAGSGARAAHGYRTAEIAPRDSFLHAPARRAERRERAGVPHVVGPPATSPSAQPEEFPVLSPPTGPAR